MKENVAYLLVNKVFVLGYKDNRVAELPVLCEEDDPLGTSFLIP